MVDFVEWLRRHNEGLPAEARRAGGAVGLYGLDVYSLHASGERLHGVPGWCGDRQQRECRGAHVCMRLGSGAAQCPAQKPAPPIETAYPLPSRQPPAWLSS